MKKLLLFLTLFTFATPQIYAQTTMDNFLGVNILRTDPTDRTSAVGFVREYHIWSLDEGFQGLNGLFENASPGYPNNLYKWNPSYQTQSFYLSFDDFYADLVADGLEITVAMAQSVSYLFNPNLSPNAPGASDLLEQKPIVLGADPTSPASYIAHADWQYHYAARFGNTVFSPNRQANIIAPKLHPNETAVTGLGYLNYLENWNEQDKWWIPQHPATFFEPEEYAAMLSADYDGHAQTLSLQSDPDNPGQMISTVGIKNADPTMQVVMGGLSDLNLQYLEDMVAWFQANRPTNATFGQIPFDVINYHHYSNKNQNLYGLGPIGISPEEDRFKEKLQVITAYRDANFPTKQLWLSEFGYDTSPNSAQRVPFDGIGSADRFEVQAQWNVRGYLEIAAAGFDRGVMFELVDNCSDTLCGLFQSSGLVMSEDRNYEPKKAWYYVSTMKNVLGDYEFDAELSPCQDTSCAVDCPRIYRFMNSTNPDQKIFAVWSPTSCDKPTYPYSLSLEGDSLATLVELEAPGTFGKRSVLQGLTVDVPVSERPIFIIVGDTTSSPTVSPIVNLQSSNETCSSILVNWDDVPGADFVQIWHLPGWQNPTSGFDVAAACFSGDQIPVNRKEFVLTGLEPDSNYTIVAIASDAQGNLSNVSFVQTTTTSTSCQIPLDPNWVFNSSDPVNPPTQLFDEQSINPICGDTTKPVTIWGKELTIPEPTSVSIDLQKHYFLDAIYLFDGENIGILTIEYAASPNGPWQELTTYTSVPFEKWIRLSNEWSPDIPIRWLRFTGDLPDRAIFNEVSLCGRDALFDETSIAPGTVTNLVSTGVSCNSTNLEWTAPFDNDLSHYEVTVSPGSAVPDTILPSANLIAHVAADLMAGITYDISIVTVDVDGNTSLPALIQVNTLPVDECEGNCDATCPNRICLETSWIYDVNIATGVDAVRLVDEQGISDPVCAGTGAPFSQWGENYDPNSGVPPAIAILDLQHCYDLETVYLFDGAGSGPFSVEYLDANNAWILLETYTTNQYNQWHSIDAVGIDTRFLRLTKQTNQAKINEIVVSGMPKGCDFCFAAGAADADSDGVPDSCDSCPGFDDNLDTDGDGIPDGCDSNCGTAGMTCDDGDPCTVNDTIDVTCACVGTFADTDNDGVCDADDVCPGFDDNLDMDGDGIPDDCDNCATPLGMPCDDLDACTVGDSIDVDCNCVGVFQDADSDGVCDNDDICPGFDDNLDSDMDGIPNGCDPDGCGYFTLSATATDVTCFGANDGSIDLTPPCESSGGMSGGNLALNQPATQSSIKWGGTADRAVDGNTNGSFYQDFSVMGTEWSSQPWWEVDLGNVSNISEIEVWNRTDCCMSFLNNFYVFVSPNPFTSTDVNATLNQSGVLAFFETGPGATPTTIPVNGLGQYVRVQLAGSGILTMAEVIIKESVGGGGQDCLLTYNWDNGAGSVQDPTSLAGGIYTVTVTNAADGCEGSTSVQILEPTELTCSVNILNNISTAGASDGSLEVVPLGGMPPYTYSWSNGQTNANANNLIADTYTVTVTNATGCTCTNSGTLNDPGSGGDYCAAQGTQPWNEWIGRIEFGGIDNSSFKELYGDFTDQMASVVAGTNQLLILTARFSWFTHNEYWNVWIDYNQNGQFDAPDELAFSQLIPAPPNGTTVFRYIASIDIPTTALTGITRMRVAMQRDVAPPPCGSFALGEVEDYSVQINPAPSPVLGNLLDFSATREGMGVNLNWVTNTEFKNSHFVLEYSINGMHFEPVHQVQSRHSGRNTRTYADTDFARTRGDYFYRLKQVHADGSFVYSSPQLVGFDVEVDAMRVFPNPTNGWIWVHLKPFVGLEARIEVVNAYGKVMRKIAVDEVLEEAIGVDLSGESEGIYFVVVDVEGRRRIVERIVLGRVN